MPVKPVRSLLISRRSNSVFVSVGKEMGPVVVTSSRFVRDEYLDAPENHRIV